MNERQTRPISEWATFACFLFIALAAWTFGSPELALVLAIGAVGAIAKKFFINTPIASAVMRVIPARHPNS